METRNEVDRLREVYRGYAARGLGSSKWSLVNRGNQALRVECQLAIQQLLRDAGLLPLGERRILDVGCGAGERLAAFENLTARPGNLVGVDLIPERLRQARQNYPEIAFHLVNAEALPFADSSFEVVTVFTVLSSILDQRMAAQVCLEVRRVLVSGGAVVWYDVRRNNPLNPHVRGISRRQVERLFPGFSIKLRTISLLPQLARRLGALTHLLYGPLSALPVLRSHYLGLLTKP